MADFGTSFSLYKLHQTSDGSSTEHSPPTLPNLSTGCASGSGSSLSRPGDLTLTVPDHPVPLQTDQGTADAARKPRGRPPGSKNKPKPPIIITRDSDVALKPVVLEISVGSDVIETITSFARIHQIAGFSVLSASGSVSNITLRQPVSHAPAISLRGPFSILSLTGSVLGSVVSSPESGNTAMRPPAPSSQTPESSFGLTIAGAQGQVFGGIVGGNLTAASKVVVVAAIFQSSPYRKLPSEAGTSGGGDYLEPDHYHHQDANPSSGCHHGVGGLASVGGDSCSNAGTSMSAYGVAATPSPLNCQMPAPDVMSWCPTSRSPY